MFSTKKYARFFSTSYLLIVVLINCNDSSSIMFVMNFWYLKLALIAFTTVFHIFGGKVGRIQLISMVYYQIILG